MSTTLVEKPKKKVSIVPIIFGCDPEFFVKDGKNIVPSEKLLPEKGISSKRNSSNYGNVIRDGVQVELNPTQSYCREILGGNITECLRDFEQALVTNSGAEEYRISEEQTVKFSKTAMDKLSSYSKKLGCDPSYNIYDGDATVGVDDPDKYLSRSAGGHIHIGGEKNSDSGYASPGYATVKELQMAEVIIPAMDIIVGNTCVLLDRSEGNVERRKTYGRAGEFRLPNHGIEYRTLSNFWLRHYTLMSLVMGLTRMATSVAISSIRGEDGGLMERIKSAVDVNDIRNAINNNDYELALSNFNKIKSLLCEGFSETRYGVRLTISTDTLPGFEKLISDGIDKYFSKRLFGNWMTYYLNNGRGREGAENFLIRIAKEK